MASKINLVPQPNELQCLQQCTIMFGKAGLFRLGTSNIISLY